MPPGTENHKKSLLEPVEDDPSVLRCRAHTVERRGERDPGIREEILSCVRPRVKGRSRTNERATLCIAGEGRAGSKADVCCSRQCLSRLDCHQYLSFHSYPYWCQNCTSGWALVGSLLFLPSLRLLLNVWQVSRCCASVAVPAQACPRWKSAPRAWSDAATRPKLHGS